MHLAIVNNSNGLVENVIVPPQGAQAWIVPNGYSAIETDVGAIGDTWDGNEFIKPEQPE
jgi:Na+-transporting NADH:ubiquinone oxidoreductase subunit NqrC